MGASALREVNPRLRELRSDLKLWNYHWFLRIGQGEHASNASVREYSNVGIRTYAIDVNEKIWDDPYTSLQRSFALSSEATLNFFIIVSSVIKLNDLS